MTVQELIDQLKSLPKDKEVVISANTCYCLIKTEDFIVEDTDSQEVLLKI